MDLRNNPDQIRRLEGCRVIEGQLSIVLMERATNKIFDNMSFPQLREVTGYILIYRTKGLRNLGDLFPNLTVVRGMQLFKDFALVIFDNEHLEALGLNSLMKIERGGVRIQHNDRLCYTNTIDWSRITRDDAEIIVRSNYDTRLCGLCPNAQSRVEEDHRQSLPQCPADTKGKLLCWDEKHCQKICPSACGDHGCMSNGTCCNSACLGGCDGPLASNCFVCKKFSFEYGSEMTCMESCPGGTYELSRRCVTEEECRLMHPPPQPVGAADSTYFRFAIKVPAYKTFNSSRCLFMCPSGYMEVGNETNATCQPCPRSGCVRECLGGKIDSVATAEQFRGCTHIKGKMEFTLRSSGGKTLSLLESALGEIREIHGCLQVTRSYPLVSLMFLKKLRKIIANPSEDKGEALHIINNENLELLWDWSTYGPIEIIGSCYIHSNPKLCYTQLMPLMNMSYPKTNFTELEVSQDSNGYQASCLPDVLKLSVSELTQIAVVLTWDVYCPDDMRKLLGYSLYFMATEKNVTLYDQRDACSDIWKVLDKPIEETRKVNRNAKPSHARNKTEVIFNPCADMQPLFYPITQLRPYTRYAAYVKTYTTIQDRKGAQSSIIYFRTLPMQPSPPTAVTVELLTPHSIFIKWSPPTMPNGTIILYHVEVQANSYNRPQILAGNINYCGNPSILANMIKASLEEAPETPEEKTTGDVKNGFCACKEEAKPSLRFSTRAEEERVDSINFENELQNQVYRKSERVNPKIHKSIDGTSKVKRSVDHSLTSMLVKLTENNSPRPGLNYSNITDDEGYVKSLYYELDGSTRTLTVKNMRHFTWYTVNIWACRNKDLNETDPVYAENWCSVRAYNTFRTLELPNTDVVSNFQVEIMPANKTLPEVNVTWEPPLNPNGFVVAYNVHYSRIEDSAQGPDVGLQSCITVDDYEANGHGYVLKTLSPGNYSVKVTPITVSGAGNVSEEIYVFIPERVSESGHAWAWGVGAGGVVLALLVGAAVWYARRGLMSHAEASKLFASVNPEYVPTVYVPDEWEVTRDSIHFIRELGQGSFGMVYEGIAKEIVKGKPETRCAIKTVNEHATDRERIEFLNEASVMKAFDTFHVVRLLGVVSRGQPTLVVMELMERGDLKTYLRSMRPDAEGSLPSSPPVPPTLQNILQMAIEIADGMAYLSAKKFVHRDLAARNCMVAGDLTVKVGDFGMTRDIYETDYYRKGTKGLMPVRWMSPESLKDGVFSSSSDAWSYGVVLWEMATLAMQPYQGLSNEQVLRYVVEGGVMERPEQCPDRLYELMRACWTHRPSARPTFLQLVADLVPHAMPYFRHRSFFHSPQGQELYALQRSALDEEQELPEVDVGAVATGSVSNLFGVSGRLASWVRELSSLRSRGSDDAAAEPLQPLPPPGTSPAPILAPAPAIKGPNGVLRDSHSARFRNH